MTQIWDPNPTFCKSLKPTTDFHREGELEEEEERFDKRKVGG